jgi:hypothetical protein
VYEDQWGARVGAGYDPVGIDLTLPGISGDVATWLPNSLETRLYPFHRAIAAAAGSVASAIDLVDRIPT